MVHSVSLSHSTDGAPWPRKEMMTVLGKQFVQCWHGKVASQVMVKDSVADRMIKSWLRNFASSEISVLFLVLLGLRCVAWRGYLKEDEG